MVGDDPFRAAGRAHALDRTRDDDEEVVGDVALSVEVLALGDGAPGAELVDGRHVGLGEGWERYSVVDHRRIPFLVL